MSDQHVHISRVPIPRCRTWEWWSSPCPLDPAGWYVRIDLDTRHWFVTYLGKVVVSEIFR